MIETPRALHEPLDQFRQRRETCEIDQVFIMRVVQSRFASEAPADQLADVVSTAKLEKFKAGDVLFSEGELEMVRILSARGCLRYRRKH